MKTHHLQIAFLVILYVCFGFSLLTASQELPERVATHFDANGNPNGWMSRSTNLVFMSVFGLAFPLFFIAICWSIRFMPACMVNIPHREYWLTGPRRNESTTFLLQHSVWLACIALAFVIGLNLTIVLSNEREIPHLPIVWGLILIGFFLSGIGAWIFVLYRRFRLATPDA